MVRIPDEADVQAYVVTLLTTRIGYIQGLILQLRFVETKDLEWLADRLPWRRDNINSVVTVIESLVSQGKLEDTGIVAQAQNVVADIDCIISNLPCNTLDEITQSLQEVLSSMRDLIPMVRRAKTNK